MEGRRGLTMIEMLVVVAVLAAITALAMPALDAWRESERLKGTVATLEAAFARGRERAREIGKPVEIRIGESGSGVAEKRDRVDDAKTAEKQRVDAVVIELAPGASVQQDEDHGDPRLGSGVAKSEKEPGATKSPPARESASSSPVSIALCLPDGTVEVEKALSLQLGTHTLDLAVSRWTGAVLAKERKPLSPDGVTHDEPAPATGPSGTTGPKGAT